MEAEDLMRSESFDLVHELGEGEESEEDEKIPGPEMLFKVPSLRDKHTRYTGMAA